MYLYWKERTYCLRDCALIVQVFANALHQLHLLLRR